MKKVFALLLLLGGIAMAERIRLEVNGQSIEMELEENAASREFVAKLPLELEFSDYASKEKIAHLPTPLSVRNTPSYEPQIGDFFYFAPWGNVGIFYGKQPPFNGLVYLGKVRGDGVEILKTIKGDFKAKITK